MLDLNTIQERDAEIQEIVEEFMPQALAFAERAPIPKTVKVFLSFIASTNFIKTGIFDLIETEDVYATKILFRSLIEHELRFQYIWFRVTEEKSDRAAEEYLKFGSFKEGLLTGKSWKRVAKVLGKDSPLTPYAAVKDVIPELASYSVNEINDRAAQFDLANIVHYISQKLKLSMDGERVPLPVSIIPEYSDLSCFVHGAPAAMQFLASLQNEAKRTADLLKTAGLSFQMAGSVKMFSLLTFFQYDKKFGPPYLKIEKLLRSIDRQPR